MKNEKVAESLRLLAEELVHGADTTKALLHLNECLCFATITGIEAAFCFAYRSHIFRRLGNFRAWRFNAQLACRSGFQTIVPLKNPSRKMPPFSRSDLFRLSHSVDPVNPFFIQHLVRKDEGRFFKSLIKLRAGNVIALIDGILKASDPLSRHFRCSWCLHDSDMDLIPCTGCSMAMFCSPSCAKIGQRSFHHEYCKHSGVKGGFEAYRDNLQFFATKLCDRMEKISEENQSIRKSISCFQEALARGESGFTGRDWRCFSKALTEEHLLLIFNNSLQYKCNRKCAPVFCNSHMIPKHSEMFPVYDDKQKDIFHLDESPRIVDQIDLKPNEGSFVGLMVNPLQELVVVNCRPNAAFISVDNQIALLVLRPISAGETIVVSDLNYFKTDTENLRAKHKQLGCNPCKLEHQALRPKVSSLPPQHSGRAKLQQFHAITRYLNSHGGEKDEDFWRMTVELELCAKGLARSDKYFT